MPAKRKEAPKAAPKAAAVPKKGPPAAELKASEQPKKAQKRGGSNPTVSELKSSSLAALANDHWAGDGKLKFDGGLVETLYTEHLCRFDATDVAVLEKSGLLERYLWPFYKEDSSPRHAMAILLLLNEKKRGDGATWSIFDDREKDFAALLTRCFSLPSEMPEMRFRERVAWLQHVTHVFSALNLPHVRATALRLTSKLLFMSLSDKRLERELCRDAALKQTWAKVVAKVNKGKGAGAGSGSIESTFFPALLSHFIDTASSIIPADGNNAMEEGGGGGGRRTQRPEYGSDEEEKLYRVRYLERMLELLIDLLSQLPTRRYLHTLLDDMFVEVHLRATPFFTASEGPSSSSSSKEAKLFRSLVDTFSYYMHFPINNLTGEHMGPGAVEKAHEGRIVALQQVSFKYHGGEGEDGGLMDLAMSSVSGLETREGLAGHLEDCPLETLQALARRLGMVGSEESTAAAAAAAAGKKGVPLGPNARVCADPSLLLDALVLHFSKRESQADSTARMALYPTESILFDLSKVPDLHYDGDTVLALPKLNLQFLTLHDYLVRNFTLFRLESTYEVREDIIDTLRRVGPRRKTDGSGGTKFTGWSRMASPIQSFKIVKVDPPGLGESVPAKVRADIVFSLGNMRGPVRDEWASLRMHDVLFLLNVDSPIEDGSEPQHKDRGDRDNSGIPFQDRVGLKVVRGCEVMDVLDEAGNRFTGEGGKGDQQLAGNLRTLRVWLDPAQYSLDLECAEETYARLGGDAYSGFNLLMRRKPKENNFKAILECIRDLMVSKSHCVVPPWLHDVFIGYGDPAAASYVESDTMPLQLDFADTFLDREHVAEAFEGRTITWGGEGGKKGSQGKGGGKAKAGGKKKEGGEADAPASSSTGYRVTFDPSSSDKKTGPVTIEPYTPPQRYRYFTDGTSRPNANAVRFQPAQCAAICSGVHHGLTMCVGPPGTGKTDVAVQIISNILRNFPNQRTLIVTHSNQALNDLFEKITQLDVHERHLVRLGMGGKELNSTSDYSKFGRVNCMLARRQELLARVASLARTLGVEADAAATCETAAFFNLQHVVRRWEAFLSACAASPTVETASTKFPFTAFVSATAAPSNPDAGFAAPAGAAGSTFAGEMSSAERCYKEIQSLFSECEECRPFEILRHGYDRGNYIVTQHAKIIAMTCTHAALKRHELVDLGFQYDNLVMEEAAQILEIETFIPMLLQEPDKQGRSRLKRVILIGDHNQLPPVVKSMAFQKFSKLDQSLFTRFVRLGTPTFDLAAQGRMRPSLADLYSWRYKGLGNLPNVTAPGSEYATANGGFALPFQLVDCGDYQGKGESAPNPFFYQNLGEAEYVVATFQYMRLCGYPADKIAVLTTYNGQKALLKDVFARRCAWHSFFGLPSKITTVDKYQGQQNDFVLLSLVRTVAVGHVRDVRRLVVAMSRARLGLYIFGRQELFLNSFDLLPVFTQLAAQATTLQLVKGEEFGCGRKVTDAPAAADLVDVADVAGMGKVVQDLIALKLPKNPTDGGQKTAPAPMEDDDGAKTPEQVGSDSEED